MYVFYLLNFLLKLNLLVDENSMIIIMNIKRSVV